MGNKDKSRDELLEELQDLKQEILSLKSTNDKDILERNQEEDAIQESEERFRHMAENSQDMLYRMSLPDGQYEYVSRASTTIFGYPPEDFRNSPFLIRKAIHPDSQDYLREQWEELLAGRMPPIYQYKIVHGKTGKIRWIHQRNTLIHNNAGQPIAIEGSATDITERKQAEDALRESEGRMEDIVFSMADWVWEVDEKGIYTYSSEMVSEILGYPINEIIGKTPFDFMPPDEAARVAALFSEIIADKKKIINLENLNISKKGEKVYILTNGVPIIDEAGDLKGYRGVDTDITERKLAEQKLIESEEQFRNLMEQSPYAIQIHAPDGTLLQSNEALANMYNLTPEAHE